MKCHYVTEPDGKRYLIPGCLPGWYDDKMCTCRDAVPPRPTSPDRQLIRELERENARLNRLLYRLLKSRVRRGKAG